MIVFTVHEPPSPPQDRAEHADALELVRDGFNPYALAVAPLWLAAHKLWLALAGYAALVGALLGGLYLIEAGPMYMRVAVGAVHLLVALEGSTIRRWTLDRAGWRMIGTATGHTADDAERRFLDSWLEGRPIVPHAGKRPGTIAAGPATGSLLGRLLGRSSA